MEIWIMSNQQPWVEALLKGFMRTKTRKMTVTLPPADSLVFLHASKTLWPDWNMLSWRNEIDLKNIRKGGVCGMGLVEKVGSTKEVMPKEDRKYFDLKLSWGSCAGPQSILFKKVKEIPFIPCKGSRVPARVLPQPVKDFMKKNETKIHSFVTA